MDVGKLHCQKGQYSLEMEYRTIEIMITRRSDERLLKLYTKQAEVTMYKKVQDCTEKSAENKRLFFSSYFKSNYFLLS